MARTCFERFKRLVLITRKMAAVCGADVVKDGYTLNVITWIVIVAIHVFVSFIIYQIYNGLVIAGDWKIMLQCLSTIGSALQGYSKLICVISGRSQLIFLLKSIHNIYEECEPDVDYLPFLKNRINIATKMLKVVGYIYIVSFTILVVYPLVLGRIRDEYILIGPFLLPGVDPQTKNGFLLHTAYHCMCVVFGSFGNFGGDMFLFIIITHIPLIKDVFRVKCVKLNRLIERNEGSEKTMPELIEILKWHQKYNNFVATVEKLYYVVVFVQISTSTMSVCCTLFCMLIGTWPAAFSYLIYSYLMLLAFCSLGNFVEKSNDEIIDIIYGTILWYELSVKEQKLVLLMLRKSQKSTNLSVGHVMPLSMETALKLTKAIYSYIMMLANFLYGDDK